MGTRKGAKKRKRAPRLTREQREVLMTKRICDAIGPAILTEVRRRLDAEIEPHLALLWQRKYQEMVDRRVVDAVRSLRLRFTVKDSDQLFDVGGR